MEDDKKKLVQQKKRHKQTVSVNMNKTMSSEFVPKVLDRYAKMLSDLPM